MVFKNRESALVSSTLCKLSYHLRYRYEWIIHVDKIADRCNDQEDDRQGGSSDLTERALREIYLLPFMLAEKNAKPWAYMTA
jgi:hypothetical protein